MPVQSVSQISTLRLKPTQEKSAQIGAEWSEKIKAQSFFSARTTERSYLDDVRKTLKAVAGRDLTPQQAEIKLRASLGKLGYTSAHGFPNAPGVAVGAKGSITDLSSTARLRLIMDTNIKQARSMQQLASSEDPIFKMANPAWRLTRVGMREKPRPDWAERWQAAGDAVGWQGAVRSIKDFVALKDSPIWEALGDGAGGFTDTLKSPYPPFAFGSGMGWVNVGRRECKRLGFDLTASDPSKEEVQAYVQKSQDGFDPTRDLGAELPAKYQDAPKQPVDAPPFAPNLSKREEAAKAIERARAAISAAQVHLESAVAEAYANVNAAEELLDEAKAVGLPIGTAAIDAVVKAIQDAQGTIAGSLGGAAQGVANLSQSLALQPTPTSNDAQQAYDAACGLLASEAGKYADSAKTQQRAANGLVSQARGLRDKIKAEIAVRVKNKCETYLKATETLLVSLADKWNAAKAEGEATRKSHQELAKRWKKLDKATQDATADEKRVCDTAEDKLKKQGNIIITDVYRADKDLAAIKSKVASGATVQDLTGKDDVRAQLRAHGAKWQAKTEKDIEAYKAMLDALRQADDALEVAIKRAEAGYKWVLTKWQTAREYGIKVAATCQDLITKIGEKAKEWEAPLTEARGFISMLKTVQNASADYVKGIDIDEIRKIVDGADTSHATFKVKMHIGEANQIMDRMDALKSQPADPAKQDEFDDRSEMFHDDLKAIAAELATVEKMLTRNVKSDLIAKVEKAQHDLIANVNSIGAKGETAKKLALSDIKTEIKDSTSSRFKKAKAMVTVAFGSFKIAWDNALTDVNAGAIATSIQVMEKKRLEFMQAVADAYELIKLQENPQLERQPKEKKNDTEKKDKEQKKAYGGAWQPTTQLEKETDALMKARGFVHIEEAEIDVKTVLANANPNYRTRESRWRENCQRCVPCAEMMRRGYKVKAKPLLSNNDTLLYHWDRAFEGGVKIVYSSKKDIITQMKKWGDGARAEIRMGFKGENGGGHVFMCEQINGETVFYDPQSGYRDVDFFFRDMDKNPKWARFNEFMRIDNLKPSALIYDCIDNGV